MCGVFWGYGGGGWGGGVGERSIVVSAVGSMTWGCYE